MIVTITEPTALPMALHLLQDQSREDVEDELHLFQEYLLASAQLIENFCGQRLMSQVVELQLDNFPSACFDLGVWPIQSVDSVKYDNDADVETTFSTASYQADIVTPRGRIRTLDSWPTTFTKFNAVRIRMTVGYLTAELLPPGIRQALRLLTAHYFNNREAVDSGLTRPWSTEIPLGVRANLMSEKMRWP